MNPVIRNFTAATAVVGPQDPVSLNYVPYGAAFFGVAVVIGDATFSVEFTLDDAADPSVTPYWFTLAEIPAGTDQTIYANVDFPIRFARLNLEAITGTVRFVVAQSTTPRA